MAYYNNYGDPRLRQGMTTNQSPVYTYLQPDETGRRPTQWEILQFARPEEIPQSPHQADRRRNRSPRGAAQEATSSVSQDRSLRQANAPIAGARYATGLLSSGAHVRVISGGGDYTSSEGENTQPRSGRPPLVYTRVWYCCTPGCPNPGPYIFALYADCTLGCGRSRCRDCTEEVIETRDREAPV